MNHNFITKILLAFGLLACAATAAYAVKAYPYPITVTQPDGTTITIQIHGDEFLNWTTSGNRLVEQGPDGFYYYASFNSDGTKSISKSRVTANPLASAFSAAPSTVRPPQSAFAAANERRQSIARIGNPNLATGKHQFLVMLIEFSDIRFTVENPQNQFHRLLNEVGYSDNGATGSSYDYYYGNSKGVFDPSFDVIGPITLEKTQSYYGDDGTGDDRAYEALADACKIADAQNLVDFSVYDQDKNGTVDNIFFFFAGSNEAEGGGVYTIWPHQWQLFEYLVGVIKLDGVSLNTSYACTSEYNGRGQMAGIGTFTHEFGHVIGLPDFYDADYDKSGGKSPALGSLSLMDQGSYNNEGRTPPYLSSYEKYMLGWSEMEEWTESGNKTLPPVQDSDKTYWTPTETEGEFFVYEFRDGNGYDAYLTGTGRASGIAIYHVDRSSVYANRWENNTINNYPNHECYDLIEACGFASANVNDNLFPGTSNKTVFNSSSTPRAEDWNGNATGYNLSNISNNYDHGSLTLTVIGGSSIEEFLDAGVNAILREDSYNAGDVFKFELSYSNNPPVEIAWVFDGQEQSPETTEVELTAGEHTVQAVLTYIDKSVETITTKLNVQ